MVVVFVHPLGERISSHIKTAKTRRKARSCGEELGNNQETHSIHDSGPQAYGCQTSLAHLGYNCHIKAGLETVVSHTSSSASDRI